MSENTDFVLSFIDAWSRNDIEELMTFFAAEAVYHNIPLAPVIGLDGIRATITGFSGSADAVEWIVHEIAETSAGVVLTERTDRFRIAGQWVELPVMGTFEVHDGKITAWRDYFDMNQFTSQLPAAGTGS